jgi:hypothetical protein
MRRERIVKIIGVFGLAAAIGSGPGLAQAPAVEAPGQGAAGSQTRTDDQELIGHALAMAIESSGLMSVAQQARFGGADTGAGGPAVGGNRGGLLGDLLPGDRSEKAPERNPTAQSTGVAATGATAAPAPGNSRRDVVEPPPATARLNVLSDVRTTQLQDQARRGFEDSQRLFRAAQHIGNEDPLLGRFLTAARDYARRLESLAGWTSGTESGQPGAAPAAGVGGPDRARMSSMDMELVCLANHAVKDLVESCKIRTMCRLMGNRPGPSEVLRQHAEQMRIEAMRTIQSLAAAPAAGARSSSAVGLVGQAQELARVIDDIDRIRK